MDSNVLYCDDNIERLSQLPDDSVDLVYLDPPFFSNRVYQVIWGDEAEVRSFEDRWEGGMQHYVAWMRERLEHLHRVLAPTGSLYLHCDPHASHYLKVVLDDIFGSLALFRNEIIWKRTGAHGSARRFGPVHDVILFYTKSAKYTWNPVHTSYDAGYAARYKRDNGDGRKFLDVALTGPGTRNGESGLPWRGTNPTAGGRHWAIPAAGDSLYKGITGESIGHLPLLERLDRFDSAGLIYWPKAGRGVPRFKQFLTGTSGVPAQDVINDIAPINSQARERLGYPTQKPEALLERVISASTNPGDVVLDPFCGCGTTVAVAERLGRQWIGIDISPTAIEIMRRRFWNQTRRWPDVVNTPDSEAALKTLKPFEFQNWIINAVNGKHSPRRTGDMGIDGYWWFTGDPVQVKQSEHVGRNVVDNFETAMRREGRDTGYVIAFSFTKGAREEVARAKTEGLSIRLLSVKEVLLLVRRAALPKGFGPQPEADVVPLPAMRKPTELPSVEELVASDQAATATA